jgi:hypothetical protein
MSAVRGHDGLQGLVVGTDPARMVPRVCILNLSDGSNVRLCGNEFAFDVG